MSTKFYTLLTEIGAAKLANATALGVPLKITQMAVGDGGGTLPTPSAQQTKLVGEKRRAALNQLYIDPQNASQIIAEQVIPENEGGWWIREVGLFDESGALIAVGNCAESYKPLLAEGSGRTQTVRMILITRSTDNITLKIDPSIVLATRKYVDDKVIELTAYIDDKLAKHVAAADPHTQYAPKASPELTGVPKAPTAVAGANSKQIATTEFVQAALAALVASSPAALDTLNELAAALGNDPNFATTMTNALAAKQPLDKTLTALSGKDVAALLDYLGLTGAPSGTFPIGMPFFWPSAKMPNELLPEWAGMEFFKWNGASFSASKYPKLALVIPSLTLIEARGEFPRIWDDGRSVDSGRILLSAQGDAIRNITGSIGFHDGGKATPLQYNAGTGALFSGGTTYSQYMTATDPGNAYKSSGNLSIDVSKIVPTASENRPRNIAFNFLVRAK